MINRRTILASAPIAAAAAGVAPAFAQSAAPAPAASGSAQAPGFYRYKVGDVEVTAINEGFFNRPLEGFVRNAELADVKKAATEAFLPDTALPIPYTTSVLRIGDRVVLIDTGFGDNGPPTSGRWMANFKAAGFDPAQVNTVIFSHFHADHISGLRLKDGTAQFPNAEIMVPEPEWAFWMDDAKMAAAPEAAKAGFANVRRVFGPMAKDVKRYEPGKELVPGVTSVAAHGHTPGHTVHMVSSAGKNLMLVADTANHPALFVRNPNWSAVFDQDADAARATRLKLLDMAASERAQVAFYHAPFPATGYIAKEGSGFRFVPVQWTSAV
jgi:glyoxylase-like metal-dependent hydrolase (beta-lactamase superfamily II)